MASFNVLNYTPGVAYTQSVGEVTERAAQSGAILRLAKEFGVQIGNTQAAGKLEMEKAARADIIQGQIDPDKEANDATYAGSVLRNNLYQTSKSMSAELDNKASDHSTMNPADYKKMLQEESTKFYKENAKGKHSQTNADIYSEFTYKSQDALIAKQAKGYKDITKEKQGTAAVTALSNLPEGEGLPFEENTTAVLDKMLDPTRFTTQERRTFLLAASRGAAMNGDRRLLDYTKEYYEAGILNPVQVQTAENAYTTAVRAQEDKHYAELRDIREGLVAGGAYTEATYLEDTESQETVRRFTLPTLKRWKAASLKNHIAAKNYSDGMTKVAGGVPLTGYPDEDKQKIYHDIKVQTLVDAGEDTLSGIRKYAALMAKQGTVDKELKADLGARLLQPILTVESVKQEDFQEALTMAMELDTVLTPAQMLNQVGKEAWDSVAEWQEALGRTNGDPEKAAEYFVMKRNEIKDRGNRPGGGSGMGGSSGRLTRIDRIDLAEAVSSIVLGDVDGADPATKPGLFGIRSVTSNSIMTGEVERALLNEANFLMDTRDLSAEVALTQAKKTVSTKVRVLGNDQHFTNGVSMEAITGMPDGVGPGAMQAAWDLHCEELGVDPDKAHIKISGQYGQLLDNEGRPFEGIPVFPLIAIGQRYDIQTREDAFDQEAEELETKLNDLSNNNRMFGNMLQANFGKNPATKILQNGTTIGDFLSASNEEKVVIRKMYNDQQYQWIRSAYAPLKDWWDGLDRDGAARWKTIAVKPYPKTDLDVDDTLVAAHGETPQAKTGELYTGHSDAPATGKVLTKPDSSAKDLAPYPNKEYKVRGLRNNNPGNIEHSAIEWQGLAPSADNRFATFSTPQLGVRAMATNIRTKVDRGVDTIAKLIEAWSPSADPTNPPGSTVSYINHIAKQTGWGKDDALDLNDTGNMFKLVKAMSIHENAGKTFSDNILREGISMMSNTKG